MKLIFLFFALLGVSNALVPGMEYEYQYEGQVKIGMPEVRNRVSGAGIRCQIQVQVQDQENVAVRLSNVQVGEALQDVDCELRDPLHLDYKNVDGHAKLLEDTFMIHPRRERGDVMETTKAEEVWISNIKRSIASLFIVVPLRNNFGVEESRESPHLLEVRSYGHSTVEEPNLFGHCSSDYSMVPLNNTVNPPAVQQQGPIYPHPWTNYEMSRTINFDHCNVSVHTKQASMGNGTTSHLTQFGDVQTRHSVMRHNLTYDGQYFILQNGTNEGHFGINPYGMNNEKIISISNQTYQLHSVKRMGQKWDLPTSTRILDTWYSEVSSPFSPGSNSPDWVRFQSRDKARYEPLHEEQFLTGIDISQHREEIKTTLDKAFDVAADIIQREEKPIQEDSIGPFDSDSANLASRLEVAFRATRSLDTDSLSQLFEKYYKDQSEKGQIKLRLLIDTLGVSGGGAPTRVILDKLRSKEISINRGASLFFAMPNNLISTPIINEIGEYIQTLDLDKDSFATATIWINFANSVNKICVNRHRYKHAVPYQLFGKEHCTDKEAVDQILPFFEQKLKEADEEWKQVVLIHAIGNLGSSRAFSTLKSIVEDERLNSTVRVAAVYAINRNRLDHSFMRYALRTFMSVQENRTDNIFVRQACIIAILSWKPPRSWYQTLASDSWRENSNDMSSFIYFILKSYAESSDPHIREQSQVARFFLPLTKPYAPSSRYSYSKLLSIYDSKMDLVTDFDISTLRAGRYSDSVPRQVLAFLVNSFGGYRFSVAQSSLSYDARDMHALLHKMSQLVTQDWRAVVRSAGNRRADMALRDVQERMGMKKTNSASLANYYFSMFEDMELLLPLNSDSISKSFGQGASLLLKEIQDQNSAKYTKFINPGILSLAVPTELGLPLISRFSLPTFSGGPVQNPSFTCDGQKCNDIGDVIRAKEVRYDAKLNYRFASKAFSQIRVLLPWNERVIISAVEALKGANLPMKFTVKLNKQDPKNFNVSVGVVPTSKNKITVAQIHTVPFVAAKNLFTTDDLTKIKVQIISASGSGKGVEKVHTPINESFTGFYGTLRYEGDVSYPFTRGNMITLLRQPNLIPSLFSSPTCRMLETSLIVDLGKSPTKEVHSSTSLHMNSDSVKVRGDLPNFKYKSTLLFNGTETRYFETNVEHAEASSSGQRHKTKLTVSYKRSQLPHFDSNPAGYCLSGTREGPKIKNFDDLRKCLQSSQNSDVQLDAELKGGSGAKACDEKHIASFKGSLKLSDERRKVLSKELDQICSYDPNDPTVTFVTSPVYDRLQLDISYQEPVPRPLKNATYQAYDMIRGWTFPHIYFNYMDQQNPKDKISIKGDRYLSEKRWKLDVRMPTESSKLDNFKMPSAIENIVPTQGIEPSDQRFDTAKVLFASDLHNHCVLRKNKVRMFDGRTFHYTTDNCETIVLEDRRDSEHVQARVRLVDNQYQLVVHFKDSHTTVVLKPNELMVDGRRVELSPKPTDIKASDGTIVGKGSKIEDSIQFLVHGEFTSSYHKDSSITIIPSLSKRGHLGGLCGNYAGDKKMIGPKSCEYSDSQLFADSWTQKQGKDCDQSHFQQIQQQVQQYQQHCQKLSDNTVERAPVLAQYSKVPLDCIEYVYKIRRSYGNICVSHDIVAICYPLCKLDKPRFYDEIYDCWTEPTVPKELLRNEKRGYIRHKIDQPPVIQMALKTEHAFICSRK